MRSNKGTPDPRANETTSDHVDVLESYLVTVLVDTTFDLLYPDLSKTADDNQYGRSNFLDYALGGDPTGPHDASLSPQLVGNLLTVGYRTAATDIEPRYFMSGDLLQWDELVFGNDQAYTVASQTQVGGRTELVLDLNLDPVTQAALFFHQDLSEPAP